MAVPKIVTTFEYPPIPWRGFDWRAFLDGDEENNRCGWGATEQEAIKNFKELYAGYEEWHDWFYKESA